MKKIFFSLVILTICTQSFDAKNSGSKRARSAPSTSRPEHPIPQEPALSDEQIKKVAYRWHMNQHRDEITQIVYNRTEYAVETWTAESVPNNCIKVTYLVEDSPDQATYKIFSERYEVSDTYPITTLLAMYHADRHLFADLFEQ
jgi:hypothetical protein